MRKTVILITMLCLAVISLQAQRGGGQRGGGERQDPETMAKQRSETLQEKLGLSDEQHKMTYEAILENQNKMREKMRTLMADRNREGMRSATEESRKNLDEKLKEIFNETQWLAYEKWRKENAPVRRRGGGGR